MFQLPIQTAFAARWAGLFVSGRANDARSKKQTGPDSCEKGPQRLIVLLIFPKLMMLELELAPGIET
jgi:hypothetical protein